MRKLSLFHYCCFVWLAIGFTFPTYAKQATSDDSVKPFGGKKETITQNSKIIVKEFNMDGTLRRKTEEVRDPNQRITAKTEEIYTESGQLFCGLNTLTTYKDQNDKVGVNTYQKFDLQLKNYQSIAITAPTSLKINSFYKKYVNAQGIPIVSSNATPTIALIVAHDIVNYMLMRRPDVRRELMKRGSRVSIMAETEMETDLPERSSWKKPLLSDPRLTPYERQTYNQPGGIGSMSDREYWNQRARGMGGNMVSCAEENLLGYPGTRYFGENILVHEFSHNIMDALRTVDPELYADINKCYQAAKSKGLYKNQYAINTVAEYWAEGSQWWFYSNFPFYEDGNIKVKSPSDLKNYDPALYKLFEKVYVSNRIPADVYFGR